MGGGSGEKRVGCVFIKFLLFFSSVWFQPHPRRYLWEAQLMLLTHGFFPV